MINMKKILVFSSILAAGLLGSCSGDGDKSDAYGNFEAEERMIGPEIPGKIVMLNLEEGMVIKQGDTLAIIDTTDLVLKVEVLKAQQAAIRSKLLSSGAQSAVLVQQKENALIEQKRFKKLFDEKAATAKQLDDIDAGIRVLDKQIRASETSEVSIESEMQTIGKQIDQLRESISKCYITSPIKGTLVEKYAEAGELAALGKNLFKIADLEHMYLRVYVSGDQLSRVKTGEEAEVFLDKNVKENQSMKGVISWISSSAEFTPKIIQTKEERVNLVYAVKVRVDNPDGIIKIAMPGEIRLKK
jgi:HlyD family secretion protein